MGKPILEHLLENDALFEGRKILVIGDIAFDRTFQCTVAPAGTHATHGHERIYDILNKGDDYGAVGASNNTLAICRSLNVRSTLVTATGSDPEGDRVEQILRDSGEHVLLARLPGIQTVTRFRFFVLNPTAKQFELLYRFDKDPDIPLSYIKAGEQIENGEFLDQFELEAATSDVILFNDTDKGFLSSRVLTALGERIEHAAHARTRKGMKRPIVLVDPKVEWDKYRGLPVDLVKPNRTEACRATGVPFTDESTDSNLKELGEALLKRFGESFPRIVVTLGPLGAIVLNCKGAVPDLKLHPAISQTESPTGVATHCGDMFATVLGLSLSLTGDLSASVDFANYVGSLQFSKKAGEKVSKADLIASSNVDHYRAHHQVPRSI